MAKKNLSSNKPQPTQSKPVNFRPFFLPASLPPGYKDWQDWYAQNPNPQNQATAPSTQPVKTDLNLILHRQASKESGMFNPRIVSGKRVSPKGAKGMAQAMPAALKEYEKVVGKSVDITDPKQSVAFQKYEMGRLMARPWANHPSNESDTVNIAKALAAYNYGSTNTVNALNKAKKAGVDIYSNTLEWLKYLPTETSDYINKILLKKSPKFEEEYSGVKDVYKDLYKNGGLIKRADGSYSRRGLWDNIRANRGSGRKPTAEMLRQERKIRAAEKKEDGGWLDAYDDGGETNPLMNIPEAQRFPQPVNTTVTYPKGYWESKTKVPSKVPLNFMGQPYATGAIEESMSPLDLIGGVRGAAGLAKGYFKYRKAFEPNLIQLGDELVDLAPHPRQVRRAVNQMHKGARELVLPNAFEDGSWVADASIPTPTTPSYYPAYPDKTLTNYQMGTSKSNLPDGKIVDSSPEIPAYAYGGMIPKYAAGATVWTEQTTPTWVAGTPTPTSTQANYVNSRAIKPESAVPYPEIKITGPTNPYAPSSNVMNQKPIQPYKKMRLHAPTTTVISKSPGSYGRMHALGGAVGAPFHHGDVLSKKNTYWHGFANGGYIPMYKRGGFMGGLEDVGKLAVNTLAAPMEQVTGNNFVNWDYNNQWAADTAAVSEGVIGGVTDVAGSVFLGPAYGMGKSQLQGITGGLGNSTEEQRGAHKWANQTGQITSSAGDLVAGITSGNPQQIVGGAGKLVGTAGGQFGSKELQGVGQLAGLASSFVNPSQGGGNTMMKTPGVSMTNTGSTIPGMDLSTLGVGIARNGGRITKKYNPPGLRYQALNPGVFAPSGMYTGPTTQRGITFADGGPVTFSFAGENHKVYIKESPTGNGKGKKGHVMVNHPTEDKGEWDTIDLTEKAGAKTVAQGVAATKKWHRENPTYADGGPIYNWIPEYYPRTGVRQSNKKQSGGWLDNI